MGIFDLFRKKKPEPACPEMSTPASAPEVPALAKVDFTREISFEEQELVTVIASAVAAGSHPDSAFRVKRVVGIDTEKEVAAVIAAAVAAGGYPDSKFRLVSIKEI